MMKMKRKCNILTATIVSLARLATIAALTVLIPLLTACSSDGGDTPDAPVPSVPADGSPITFDITQDDDQSQTRSTMLEGVSDLQSLGISVTSKINSVPSQAYFSGERLTYNTDDYWEMHQYYWIPDTPLDFYARAPYDNSNVGTQTGNSFSYEIPETIVDQRDTMYNQYKKGQTGDAANVILHFKHALSALSFKARTTSPAMSVIVNGITIHNLTRKGTFTYPTGSTCDENGNVTENICSWVLGAQTDVQEAGIIETELSSDEEARSVMAENGVMMVMPQTLTGSITSGSYLTIECKLMDTGLYLAGSATEWGTVYVPFDFTFEQGKHYTVTLEFGVGFNAEGIKNQIRIDLESTITDWNRETMTFDKYIL